MRIQKSIYKGSITFLAIACLLIFGLVSSKWPGSISAYGFMTFAFLGLLAVGIRHFFLGNVGFALLAILLWVGYWLKLAVHILNETPWVEPIGGFQFSAREWDLVATVSATGALALVLVGLLWRFPVGSNQLEETGARTRWKPGARALMYLLVIVIVAATILANETFGLSHNGLRPAVDLPWPFQGLFNWTFVIGISLLVSVILYLDAVSGHSMVLGALVFIIAVTLLGISQYSRGIAAMQILPLIAAFVLCHKNMAGLSKRGTVFISAAIVAGVLVSVIGGQERRIQDLPNYDLVQEESNSPSFQTMQGSSFSALMGRLVIDRWVGLEGVMAVVAYPEKGVEFFKKMVAERRTKDKVDTFTRVVSKAGSYDTSKYHFATIPGAFAFLYYSNSLVIVFAGAALFGWIVFASENLVRAATGNIFLSAQTGFYSAMLFIQLGAGGLVQPGSVLVFTLAAAVLAGFMGRYFLARSESK